MKLLTFYILVICFLLFADIGSYSQSSKENRYQAESNLNLRKVNSIKVESEEKESDLLKKATTYEKSKDYTQAEAIFKELVKKYPNQNNFLDFGHFYARQKKFDKAVPLFYKAIKNIQYDYAVLEDIFYKYQLYDELLTLYLKGDKEFDDMYLKRYFAQEAISMYKLLARYDEAILFIANKIKNTDDRPAYYFRVLSDIALKEEKSDLVLAAFDEIAQSQLKAYTRFLLHRDRGDILFHLSRFNESVQDYKIAIQSTYYSQYDVEYLFKRFESKRLYEESLLLTEVYIKYLENKGIDKKLKRFYYDLLKKRAELHQTLGNEEKAVEYFLELIKRVENTKRPNYYLLGDLYYLLGKIYFSQGSYQKARATFLKVDKKRVKESRIYIARCYIAESSYEDAEKILLISGESDESRYYAALIALFQNKIKLSKEQLETLILQYGDSERATIALEKLEMLYQIEKDEEKLKGFIEFEKLWERQDVKGLETRRNELVELFQSNEDQKSYFLIQYAQLFIRKKQYKEGEELLLSIKEKASHPFWKQKSSYLLGKLWIEHRDKPEEGIQVLIEMIKAYPKTIFLLPAKELIRENQKKNKKKDEPIKKPE